MGDSEHLSAGAYSVSGGAATMTVHRALPPDHPLHSLVGQIASKWAMVERFLDMAIWRLAKVDDETGACMTGQIIGSHAKLVAIHALLVRRRVDQKLIDQLKQLSTKMKDPQDRRNRILHDAWYVTDHDQQTQQFKNMARDEFLFGFYPVDESFLKETLEKMERRFMQAGELINAINDARF